MLPLRTLTRRQVLETGLASLALPWAIGAAPERGTLTLRLEETAGLRRFGYPVRTLLPVLGANAKTNYRLTRNGQAVPAQFRLVEGLDGKPAVLLEFNASPGPGEPEDYAVAFGTDVEPGPEPSRGMVVEREGSVLAIANKPSLTFSIRDDLSGFLKGVRNAGLEFLVEGADGGLFLRDKDDVLHRSGGEERGGAGSKVSITRRGPIAAGLRFEQTARLPGGRAVHSSVAMTFPNSKSWVETEWRIEDPEGLVAGLGLDLPLRLSGETALVDFGAASTVYGQIKGQEQMDLVAGRAIGLPAPPHSWLVRKGPPRAPAPFAQALRGDSPGAEGWAHVMDATRCTALAVAGFGRATRDGIRVEANGRLRVWRDFSAGGAATPRGPKALTFWLHFVTMPVQVGAATSPQAMLAPLEVRWLDPRS